MLRWLRVRDLPAGATSKGGRGIQSIAGLYRDDSMYLLLRSPSSRSKPGVCGFRNLRAHLLYL